MSDWVMAIDPSTKKIAMALSRGDGSGLDLRARKLPADKHERISAAHFIMKGEIARAINVARQDDPKARLHVFLEEPIVWGSKASTLQLGKMSGAIESGVYAGFDLLGTESSFQNVNPSRWKAVVVGNGSAKKPAIGSFLRKTWNKAYQMADYDEDLIDAICINRYGAQILRITKRIVKKPLAKRSRRLVKRG